MRICISDESDRLLDTGGQSAKKARPLFNPGEPVLFTMWISCQILIWLERAKQHDPDLHLATYRVANTSRQLLFDRQWNSAEYGSTGQTDKDKWVEGHSPAEEYHMRAFTGIHLVSPRILPLMIQGLDVFRLLIFIYGQLLKGVVRGADIPGSDHRQENLIHCEIQ